jgi:PAS domain-containing protein
VLGETGDVRGINAAAEQLLGYKADELVGGPFQPNREIMRERYASEDGLATAIDWRSMRPMDTTFRRKNGNFVDVVCTLHPLERNDAGSILLTFREREREPVEAIALKDIEAKLDVVFDTMPDGLIVIEENGRIRFFSSGAERVARQCGWKARHPDCRARRAVVRLSSERNVGEERRDADAFAIPEGA